MKKKILNVLLCLCMVCSLLPMTALAAAGDHTNKVKVAGEELSVTGYYRVTDSGVTELDNAPAANETGYVHWDTTTGILTLCDVTLDGGNSSSGIYANGNFTIVLAENTSNTVESGFTNAITCDNGSVTIKGSGTLNATGATNGIKAKYSVSIVENANVTVTGEGGCGIVHFPTIFSDNADPVTIGENVTAEITGSTYGIGNESGYGASPRIYSPNVTIKGGTAAFDEFPHGAPTLGAGIGALASLNSDGSAPTAYNSENYSTYKWFESCPSYTVSFNANGGTGTMNEVAVPEGGSYTLPANGFTAPEGKEFDTWALNAVNGTKYAPNSTYTVNADTIFYAIWAQSAVAVTGVTLDRDTLSLATGGNAALTATVAPDNATDKTVTWTSSDETVATVANGVVTAVKAGTATITATAGGKSATCAVEVTDTPAAGQQYNLWVGGVQVTSSNAANITGAGITGNVSYDSATNTLTLNNATITRAHEHWYAESCIYSMGPLNIKLVGNNTITGTEHGASSYGIYIETDYIGGREGTLTFTGSGSLTVASADLSEDYWSVAIFASGNITVNSGCRIAASCGNSSGTQYAIYSYSSSTKLILQEGVAAIGSQNIDGSNLEVYNGDVGRYKHLEIGPARAVSFDKNGHGTAPAAINVPSGSKIPAPTAPTADGYTFGGWFKEALCTNAWLFDTYTVTQDTTLYAKWTENAPGTYTVTVTNGTASPSGSQAAGTVVTLTADAAPEGKMFDKWIVTGATVADETAATTTFTMPAGNVTAEATYKIIPVTPVTTYTVSFDANGGSVSPTSSTTGADGKLVSLPTPTRSGSYSFDGWYTAAIGGTKITTATVFDSNTIIFAQWTYTGGVSDNTPPSSSDYDYTPPTYKVESGVDEDTNGSIRLSTDIAKKGDTVTITVIPDPYYHVEKVIVKDRKDNIIAVKENKDGTFSFKMPASKVTVEPVFSWDNPFKDVTEDAYYTPAVEWALKNNITRGTSATTFSPDASCTRAQMATFLWQAAGSPNPMGSANPFTDVSADAYYAKAVQWAYEQGITGGTSATTFSPDADCTRAQMATFLWSNADSPVPAGGTNPFTDVAENAYYATAVQWAHEQKITDGTSATTFGPNDLCTRAQMITFLYRCFGK